MKTRVKEFRIAQKLTQKQLEDLVYVSSRTIILIVTFVYYEKRV